MLCKRFIGSGKHLIDNIRITHDPKAVSERVPLRWEIVEKETVDEIIFRTTKVRNRLILELMARGGMRIGEVLKLRLKDLQDRKLLLREPKSGKEHEFVFILQKVADRLHEYAMKVCNASNDRVFPISYEAARMMVIKYGKNTEIFHENHAGLTTDPLGAGLGCLDNHGKLACIFYISGLSIIANILWLTTAYHNRGIMVVVHGLAMVFTR